MALLNFFKVPRHQQFEYRPRFWDPDKEAMEERLREIEKLKNKDPEAIKARIASGFRRGGGYHQGAWRARTRQTRRSNMILLLLVVVLLVLSYIFLNVYLPGIVESIEGSQTVIAHCLTNRENPMADIIQLLPDSIANQIAAGEVIQRPSSVVKELMENAIDAGSNSVKLIVKDAGRTLVQVIDNGCGMSETDARMSFERHATSKVREAKDLFAIRTMGFRGEAMASIAAIAQVEMRTRRQPDELGTRLVIEGSEVKVQEACQCNAGTNISVKNLFFNVPARRNFLKSNSVEMRHILDEFQRIAIANPDIFFSLHRNGEEIFHLQPGNQRQRIVGIFGANSNKKLVPVSVEIDIMNLSGFIGKPEFAKKTRGEQMFFVNGRFIKSGYLHHAVTTAFEKLLPDDTHPMYALFIEIDPARIDINVHPTKQEIKFDDERHIYKCLKVAIKHALGQFSIAPTLDFDQEVSFSPVKNFGMREQPQADVEKNISSFSGGSKISGSTPGKEHNIEANNLKNWQKIFDGLEAFDEKEEPKPTVDNPPQSVTIESQWETEQSLTDAGGTFSKGHKPPYQIHATYIVSHIKSGFLLIDQKAAHERILYERYLAALESRQAGTQKELFPTTITLSPIDAAVIKEILPEINLLGFDMQEFGKDTFIIHGIPAEMVGHAQKEQKIIETLLEQYKQEVDMDLGLKEKVARAMARSTAVRRGQTLSPEEMQAIIDKLFACQMPYKSPGGRACFITYDLEELAKKFV